VFVAGLFLALAGLVAAATEPAIDHLSNDKTALMSAARQADAGAVARLIAAGADVNARNTNGGP
jgi:ankyrin repeat protein